MTMTRRAALALAIVAAPAPAVESGDLFADRMNRFGRELVNFDGKLRQHVFDVKQAKLLSKLWRDVETSGEWPEMENK
jgi:hypothetical protein